MTPTGFLRATAASVPVQIGNPSANRQHLQSAIAELRDSDLIVFGELSLSGYTCGELFKQSLLLEDCRKELLELAKHVPSGQLVVVGTPWEIDNRLYNCAAVLNAGRLIGLVPKQNLPTYKEFYESRWFTSGEGLSLTIDTPSQLHSEQSLTDSDTHKANTGVPVGSDLLFQFGKALIGVEICEDLWVPIPPSSFQAIAGANLLINLSASNETVGKASFRRSLVTTQSGRCNAAYIYASAGPTESTTDLVFGGHCLIAECGTLLAESKRVGTGLPLTGTKPTEASHNRPATPLPSALVSHVTVDIDIERINHDRRSTGTMHQSHLQSSPYRKIEVASQSTKRRLQRWIDPHPFVPKDEHLLEERCNEIFEIQIASLAKRISQLSANTQLVIGVSGGLDSTLATLVTAKMLDAIGQPATRLLGLTMPGFGTSQKTKSNALDLIRLLGLKSETIDIRPSCMELFKNLQHAPFGVSTEGKDWQRLQHELEQLPDSQRNDLVFENVQARMRTLLLMSRGFVIGTGDLSEGALGWSTYNADHMSMYNVNCSIPKTLVRFLVRHVANTQFDGEARRVLLDIADTPISPELLPLAPDKSIHQSTEGTVGPYELHDFFLYHFVRAGATPEKILELAANTRFDVSYSDETIRHWLKTFLRRFFAAQYKRSCVPDGPKVGSVSLSPRGDWRMPSDADASRWLEST